ncbi:MAG: TIGR00269 family protein, partial [Nanoarchaeota archaeon]|nr:TIGR00269 family protein [Nanoarchaeota archaeon]
QFDLIGKKENLGVAISGGKDSLTLLYILNKLSKQNPKIKLTAILIDEGIKGYRNKTIKTAKKFCSKNKIKLNIFSFKEEFGMPLDKMLKALNAKPCTLCGIFRRYLLNKKSKELGFTKLATGHNLDDECQSILMNQFKNNLHLSARLGPKVGIKQNDKLVQRIKPLYLCSEKETTVYAFANNLLDSLTECPYVSESYRAQVRDMLNDFEAKFPGTKHGIVNSFLDILPELKKKFSSGEANFCKICGEAAAKDKCNACKYVEKLEKAANNVGIA